MALVRNSDGTYTDRATGKKYAANAVAFTNPSPEDPNPPQPFLKRGAQPIASASAPAPAAPAPAPAPAAAPKLTSKGTYAVSDWSNVDAIFPKTRQGTGAEDSDVTYQNDAYTQFKNLENSYWAQFLPQLGFTGPMTKEVVTDPDPRHYATTTTISDEAAAAIQQFKAQGYDIVINPKKIDSGSKSVTEFAFKTPDGKLQKTWEYTGGAWYEQIAPYLGLVLPAILGIAGTKLGVTGTGAGGAVTVTDTINALGANITGTSNELLNRVVGAAVVNGAKELIVSGGDPEEAIKGALTAGALAGAAGIAEPYVEKAADALSSLTGDEVAQLAGTDVSAADVAGNVGDVDVGGAGAAGDVDLGADPLYGGAYTEFNTAQSYINLTDYGKDVYAGELALGKSPDAALISAFRAESLNFPTTGNALATGATTPDTAPANALVTGGNAPEPYQTPFTQEDLSPNVGGAIDFTPGAVVTPPGNVATVDLTAGQAPYDPYTGLAENFPTTTPPIIPPTTGAGLGTAGAGAGTGISGPGISATPGAGLDLSAGTGEPPGGRTSTVVGGTGITPGTTSGAGLDTTGLTIGGTIGAGAAVGSVLGGDLTAADLEGLDPNLTLGGGTDALGGTDVTGGTGAIVTGAAGGAGAGAITAGGAAAGAGAAAGGAGAAAAGLTGIKVVDDFLDYLGTPAGAAALGAFGSLASGYLTGQAAKDAAQIQADSAANALKLQRDQFDYQKELLEPYRKAGESALGRLTGAMGLGGQAGSPQQLLEMDPGYAFRLGEGMKALERVQAARGNMLSGGAIKAGQRYAQDFASGEYGNAYNRLANIAGLGQTVGGQLGTAAQQFGQTAGDTMSQGANALAAGRIGRTSGYMSGIGGAVGAYQNYQNQQQQNQLFGRYLDIYGRAVGAGG